MKNNKVLYIVLSSILLILVGSSIYINYIAKNSNVVSYILIAEIMLGIISGILTLFLCVGKKSYKVLLISFLQVLLTIGLVILNTVYGYRELVNLNSYSEYMEYVSMNMNIYLFVIFGFVMGLFTLDQYIKSYCNKEVVKQ